ncbi:hypothetical protein SAMN05421640_1262 [Ekhidna lutea]|uniref:DUF5683 domain-containing protein n=1 Tax=Ekhidna lutea TaxID=447679 RepID=A0A239HDI9_EKHLU|nr:DUF5683 domain-containing protein [Ekhidna lutea]SNS79506.1 hypothetical protein SAMN05421640_1262 [Ekhidna lutea]
MKKLLFVLSIVCLIGVQAQDKPVLIEDSTFIKAQDDAELFQEVSELDPQRAALLSAIFPGLGQAYNKQYWKVPLVWAGVLTFGHFIDYNNKVYHGLRNAALLNAQNPELNPYKSLITNESALIRNRDVFRRNRDMLIIVGSAFYILQIVDAHVSAHLEEFKLNDSLALGIEPSIQPTPLFSQAVGVSFVLKF